MTLRDLQQHFPTASINYSLEYETRAKCASYWKHTNEKINRDKIGFFHMFEASICTAADVRATRCTSPH